MKLDEKGRCCGRKPLIYKCDSMHFCCRCDRAFNLESGEQVENWAWMKRDDRFVLRCGVCRKREGTKRERQGFSAGQQCDECYAASEKKYGRMAARKGGAE